MWMFQHFFFPASKMWDLKCELISWLLCRDLWGFKSHIKATTQIYPRPMQLNLLTTRHPSFIYLLVLDSAGSVLLRTRTFWWITFETLISPPPLRLSSLLSPSRHLESWMRVHNTCCWSEPPSLSQHTKTCYRCRRLFSIRCVRGAGDERA